VTGAGLEDLAAQLLRGVATSRSSTQAGAQHGPGGALAASGAGANGAGARSPSGADRPGEEELAEHMVFRPSAGSGFQIERLGPRSFAVRGKGIEQLLVRYDIENEDAMAHVEGRLRRIGVLKALEAEGFQPGDEIEIAGVTFELDPSAAP
jgi:Obg family GTPase CgtA-like protein